MKKPETVSRIIVVDNHWAFHRRKRLGSIMGGLRTATRIFHNAKYRVTITVNNATGKYKAIKGQSPYKDLTRIYKLNQKGTWVELGLLCVDICRKLFNKGPHSKRRYDVKVEKLNS